MNIFRSLAQLVPSIGDHLSGIIRIRSCFPLSNLQGILAAVAEGFLTLFGTFDRPPHANNNVVYGLRRHVVRFADLSVQHQRLKSSCQW